LIPVGLVIVASTVGYMLFWGWTPLEALYMTAITVGTVGFREVRPLTAGGQVFTIVVVFAGILAGGYALAQIFELLLEDRLRGSWEARKMTKSIDSLQRHTVLAGLGRVGGSVADTLDSLGEPFVVVDLDEDALAAARDRGWLVVVGDATEEDVLRAAGIERAAAFVTALDTDALNMFTVVTVRDMCPSVFIVARSSHVASEEKLLRAGANRVLTPNVIGGRRLAMMALNPTVSDYLDLVAHGSGLEYRLQEVTIQEGSRLADNTIAGARVRELTGAYILAVRHGDGRIDSNPAAETELHAGDVLVVLGTAQQVDALATAV
jgi:voltage-gated potassium channel